MYVSVDKDLIRSLKLVVCDVDGVLTDGGLYYSSEGEVIKRFNSKDGVAFSRLKSAGYSTALLSAGRVLEIVKHRADDLGVNFYYSGELRKEQVIEKWITELGIGWSEVCYIGDDLQDLAPIKRAGFSACPSDAVTEIKEAADVILESPGGSGCFRELVDGYVFQF